MALPPLERVMDQIGAATGTGYSELQDEKLAAFVARDGWVQAAAPLRRRIAEANQLAPVALSEAEIAQVLAFLDALSDPGVAGLASIVPASVPSGLAPQPKPAVPPEG